MRPRPHTRSSQISSQIEAIIPARRFGITSIPRLIRAFLGWTITGVICGGATAVQNGHQGLLLFSTALAGAIIIGPCGFLLCFGRWNGRSVTIGLCAGLLIALILKPWTRACYAECLMAGALTASLFGSLRLLLPRARQLVFEIAPVTVFEPLRGRSSPRETR